MIEKSTQESALADARLAREKHDLSLTGDGSRVPIVQLCELDLASDYNRRRFLNHLGQFCRFIGAYCQCHASRKAVALGRHRHHESGRIGIVPQRTTDLPHCGINRVINIEKHLPAPNAFADFFSSYERPAPIDQQEQQIEWYAFKFEGLTIAAQFICAAIEFEIGKSENPG